jgi:predicted nucleic acid-binding Zn ribbon protein
MAKGRYHRKSNEQTLGDAIQHFVNAMGLRPKMTEADIVANWEEIVGKMIAKHTLDLSLNRMKLTLRFDNAALKQEMSYAKSTLIENINERFGREIINEVVIL